MDTTSKRFGAAGEELAGCYLRKHGYKILFKNYHCPLGEVDFIARHREVLVFVEVKSRRTDAMGAPEESVTFFKRRQLTKCAAYFLNRYQISDRPCRFDVVSVFSMPNLEMRIELIQDAFYEER